MKRLVEGFILVFSLAVTTYYYPIFQHAHEPSLKLHRLPPTLALRIFSMGNKELMSVFIFYNCEFYFGEKVGFRKETPEFKVIYDALNKATDLDPYNMDCYYFAQGILSWIKPAIPVLNRLLEKGFRHRTWDWYLPFFIGANYYFRLNNPLKAAEYMQKAYKLNPKSAVLATLAARMYYQAKKTEAGIIYLRSLIKHTRNPILRKRFIKRLRALEAIYVLEQAVSNYEKLFGHKPKSIDELINKGVIKDLPVDPYGGEFFIGKDGRIHTTSKMAERWRKNGTNKGNRAKEGVSERCPQKKG